jgi:AcrR family transcriptional regulator
MGKKNDRPDARQRILEAAGEAFAEGGYKDVTVRGICGNAGVNVASINYHFGDKDNLYREVVKHWQAEAYGKYPPEMGTGPDSRPEDRLRGFIRSFLFRMLDQGRPSWYGRFVAREFIEPTPAHAVLVEETIRPSFLLLSSIVRDLMGGNADAGVVNLCCASIVGQCLYFENARPVAGKLPGNERPGPVDIERIAEHVTAFSLNAIRGLASAGKGGVEEA